VVLEVGCGSGQGLGILSKAAHRIVAADYTEFLIRQAHHHYGDRIPLLRLDAHTLPFKPHTFDTIILYEAIYYLKNPNLFIEECLRILKRHGTVLVCNANKNLPDFNPSPYSHHYFSPADFRFLFKKFGLRVECFGDFRVNYDRPIQKLLTYIKRTAVRLNLMPKTMRGKLLFKRLVFGKLLELPPELEDGGENIPEPVKIDSSGINQDYKVILAVAVKREESNRW
jgi:ubiquinone/menaquinone biosynthesis C-methylase UbiE